MSDFAERMPSPGAARLTRNTLWNLLGNGLPLLVAVVVIPSVLERIGPDRFGVLTVVWILTGYSSLFEPGIARAVTRAVASRLGGAGDEAQVAPIVWGSVRIMLIFGTVSGFLFAAVGRGLLTIVVRVPPAVFEEVVATLYLLAASLPLVCMTMALAGAIAGYQQFGLIAAIRIPASSLSYVAPLVVSMVSTSLVPIVAVLILVRLAATMMLFLACRKIVSSSGETNREAPQDVGALIRSAGWMTVSNVIGPAILYLDRLVILGLMSVSALTYYATPYVLVDPLRAFPAALMGATFPVFAASYRRDPAGTARLFERTLASVFAVLFPITLLLVAFSREILILWLGAEFAQASTMVMRLITVSVFLSCVGRVPFALLQGVGRADLTAKLHVVELPAYLVLVLGLTLAYGPVGAAAGTAIRALAHLAVLLTLSWRLVPSSWGSRKDGNRRSTPKADLPMAVAPRGENE